MMAANQRQEPREPRDETIHIQVQHAPSSVSQPALVLHASTRDISAHGFNASSNLALPTGSLLDVLIELRDSQPAFLLTAEVRWCRPQPDGDYSIGFAVIDASGSDYQAWQRGFAAP